MTICKRKSSDKTIFWYNYLQREKMGKGDGQGSDVNNNLKKNDQIQQLVNKVIRYGNVQAICDILYNLQTIESK